MTLPNRRDGGFTLIEILVVVVVLGLLASLVAARGPPRSTGLSLRGAAAQMAQAMRVARTRAIATNRPVTFTVATAAHAYALSGAAPHALPGWLDVSMVAAAALAQAQAGAIVFLPDGSSTGGRVTLSGAGHRAEVAVDWLTGRVAVTDAT